MRSRCDQRCRTASTSERAHRAELRRRTIAGKSHGCDRRSASTRDFSPVRVAMMHGVNLITTLAGSLCAALVFGYITQRLRLSPIVGYLLGGGRVGPHTPGFVADVSLAEQLAEIGVILLMFGVGLQFHFNELLAVRGVAVPGAIAQSVAATLLGAAVAPLLG